MKLSLELYTDTVKNDHIILFVVTIKVLKTILLSSDTVVYSYQIGLAETF